MNIILMLIIVASLAGGAYLAAPYLQETQTSLLNVNANTESDIVSLEPEQNQDSNLLSSPSSLIGKLYIVNAQMYSHATSEIVIKNTGTDTVVLNSIFYGQIPYPTTALAIGPSEEGQITLTGVTGAIGSKYVLQIEGTSVSTGQVVTAQTTAVLNAPISKLEVTNSQMFIINSANPTLQLTLHNSGMDTISVIGITLGKPIPARIWAAGVGSISLQASEEKTISVQLDSLDYLGGVIPKDGSARQLTVTGRNSIGHTVSTVAVASIDVSTSEETAKPEPDHSGDAKISMSAVARLDASASLTVTYTINNDLGKGIIVDSLKIDGGFVPGANGLTLASGATISGNTIIKGKTFAAGSFIEVELLGKVIGDSTPVYGFVSAEVQG